MASATTSTSEDRIQHAIRAIQADPRLSIRKAANLFNAPYSTLQARISGRRPAQEVQQAQQRLSIHEEAAIEKCVITMTSWGWPMTIKYLESLARNLLIAKGDYQPLGQNWYKNFLARHPGLKTKWSRSLDQSRKDATDHNILQEWFKLYNEVCAIYGIANEDKYNMDEKGFSKGIGDNAKVLIPVTEEEAFSIQPGNREWVSVIECIGLNGYSLPPFVIFQGQRIQQSWINSQIDNRTAIRVSENGWTDSRIALDWLEHFNKYTQPQTVGEYRLLILDGHSSHVSLQFIEYCEQHKILPLCLPPHSTHILQPLDVGVFSPLAKAYKSLIQSNSIFGAERVDNERFLIYFQQARRSAISTKNIASAWRAAGLQPFNPAPIIEKHMPKPQPFTEPTNRVGICTDTQELRLAQEVSSIIADVLSQVPADVHPSIKRLEEIALACIANNSALNLLNQGLVQKQQQARTKKSRKAYGTARLLTVEEAHRKVDEAAAKEREAKEAKERAAALRGKVGFAKAVWKEFNMDFDVFT